MRDITHKPDTLRSARAGARLTAPAEVIEQVKAGQIDKGDPVEAAKTAGYLAAKKTWDLLPLCHPLSIYNITIEIIPEVKYIEISVLVETIGPTGVEMEALTAASVSALTLYDMLKPHAGTEMMIDNIRLLEKKGGKSQYQRQLDPPTEGSILISAQSLVEAEKRTKAAEKLAARLADAGIICGDIRQLTGDDNLDQAITDALDKQPALLITLGGTGIMPDDHSVEALSRHIKTEMPGMMEAARQHGQRRTPYAMMSRGIAGINGKTLLISFPGSARGAMETLDAILPGMIHTLSVIRATHQS